MVELSNKAWLVITVIVAAAAVFVVCAIANIGGIGTALAGLGGPAGTAAYGVFSAPLAWALSGGGPTLAGFWLGIAILLLVAGVMLERKVIPRFGGDKVATTLNQTQPSQNSIPISADELQNKPK